MMYAIPPTGYTQAEAFRAELERVQKMIAAQIIGFESPAEVAAWLKMIGFRTQKPVTEKQVKTWCRTRHFPYTRPRGLGLKWFTTSAHVLAWLWTYATYAPKRKNVGVA